MIYNDKLPEYINTIINARKDKGLSQGELAKLIDCRREHLCGIEKARCEPSFTILRKICDELNLKIQLVKND
jgi:DNA-binding XRE family transcriptional regulator